MMRRLNSYPVSGEVVFYTDKAEGVKIEIRLKDDTLWMDAHKISRIFEVERPAIVKHVHNIYKSGELDELATCSILEQVASDGRLRKMNLYNLDMIISIGYRVNSKRATQFRIWATDILRRHLVEGYTINQKQLKAKEEKFLAFQRAIRLIEQVKSRKPLEYREAMGLLDVIRDYSRALGLLDDYDNGRVAVKVVSRGSGFRLTHELAIKAVEQLKTGLGGSVLFGREKDKSFASSVSAIYQTFSGRELYPSAEEKAAHLLYFIVKNHSFVDGNKRIAAAIFLWFLEKNRLLYRKDGSKRLADNALVALTLMIAESDPNEKDLIVRLVVNLINKEN
jgi:prophage maintenance system killer protein